MKQKEPKYQKSSSQQNKVHFNINIQITFSADSYFEDNDDRGSMMVRNQVCKRRQCLQGTLRTRKIFRSPGYSFVSPVKLIATLLLISQEGMDILFSTLYILSVFSVMCQVTHLDYLQNQHIISVKLLLAKKCLGNIFYMEFRECFQRQEWQNYFQPKVK